MTKTTELTPVKKLEMNLGNMSKQFASTLPAHISTQKFLRAAVSAVQNTPDLQECEQATIISACQKAATDGLIIDNREASLVVFNKKIANKWEKHAQYMPMVAGILKKARNSGQISSLTAHVVYDNDLFEYELGLEPILKHVPTIDSAPGNLKCAYAIAKLKDGSTQFEVMTRDQIMKVAMSSKSGWNEEMQELKGIWKQWEDEMWRKTVLKRLCKYLPSSSDLDGIIDYDNNAFGNMDQPAEEPEKVIKEQGQTKAAAAILNKQKPAEEKPIEGEVVSDNDPI